MAKARVTDSAHTLTVRVPLSIKRRGGRKLVLAPDGSNVVALPTTRRIDNAMIKAIARGSFGADAACSAIMVSAPVGPGSL